MKYRVMTEEDFNSGWAGVELAPHMDQAWISEDVTVDGKDAIAILDANGLQIFTTDDEWTYAMEWPMYPMDFILSMSRALGNELMGVDLCKLGFIKHC